MKYRKLAFVTLLLSVFIISNNYKFIPASFMSWDGFGYYLYLPLTFIYHDPGLKDLSIVEGINEKYECTVSFYQLLKAEGHDYVIKYTMGQAIFYAPSFFIAHLIASSGAGITDGFSEPYQYCFFIGNIIYTLIGLFFLSKILVRFFSEMIAAFLLIILVLGTNFLVHNTMYGQNMLSHNHLFFTYTLIIWNTIKWHEKRKLKNLVITAIFCGLTILSRPSEFVCVLIPLLWGVSHFSGIRARIEEIKTEKKNWITFFLIITAIGSLQLIYWKLYSGSFIFDSYGANAGEGFEFLHPYISEILFSFRKGWLIYTPIMSLAIAGFYFIYKKSNGLFIPLFLYFIFNLYIAGSWSCWWYAQSFSQRALIPSYPVMLIALGYFFTYIKTQNISVRILFFGLSIFFILFNLFQTYQFYYGIISNDRMTGKYYFEVFGQTSLATDEQKKLLLINRSFDDSDKFSNKEEYVSKILNVQDFETDPHGYEGFAHSGKYSYNLKDPVIYSPGYQQSYKTISKKDHIWIRVTAYVYPVNDPYTNLFALAIQMEHNDRSYKFEAYESDKMNLQAKKWNKISFEYLTPEIRRPGDPLKVYFTNWKNADVYIDDITIEAFEKK